MNLNYIDAHAHLNFNAFDNDRKEVINALRTDGGGAINIGVDVETSAASIKLAEEHEHIWPSVGCHPTAANEDFNIDRYRDLIEKNEDSIVAVGECGLDYFRSANRDDENKKLQREVFEAQVKLAIKKDLPLILHMRPREGSMDAYEEGLDILEYYSKNGGKNLRGTAHFFVGDDEIAARFLDINFHISVTGVITFDDSLRATISSLPTDRLLVETDAPFAAPVPHRGERNSPLYVPDIISALAEEKGIHQDELAVQIVSNTQRLFSL